MELLEGRALRRALLERRLELEEAISIARDMARGLARAHAAGVVHRDIKPENVFLTQLGGGAVIAKVLDFGLARQRIQAPASGSLPPNLPREEATNTDTTSRGDMWGTPGYVSPEQALGQKEIDARTDIFSFGVVFYEMLANIRPFRGETAVATRIASTRSEPRPLPEIVPGLPPAIDEIVKRCLRKKKEERFQDAGELSAALEAFARGGTASSHSLRLPLVGSSPSLPFISQSPSQVPPIPQRPSHPGPTPGSGPNPGEGDAATTGSAALLSTRQETLLALQEQERDRRKLFAAVGAVAAVALVSGIILIALALTGDSKKKPAAAASVEPALVAEAPSAPVASPSAPPGEAVDPASAVEATPAAEPAVEPTPAADPASAAAAAPAVKPASAAPAVAAAPRPVAHPLPRLAPAPAPAGSGKKKPADCAKSPFTIDSKGVRIPKLYCF
jgi:serine/threonine-protein kinase